MITFFDVDGSIVKDPKDAARFEIKEFNADGDAIFLSMGDLK
jgi:hypothetical protein